MSFHSSFCTIAFRNTRLTVLQILKELKKYQYTGIEIWGDHLQNLTSLELTQIAELAKELDIKMPSIDFYLGCFDITKKNQSEIIELTKRACEIAKILGVSNLRSFVGKPGSVSSLDASPEQWDYVVDGFRKIQPIIENDDKFLFLELHRKTLIDSLGGVEKFFSVLPSSRFKLILQLDDLVANSNLSSPKELYIKLRQKSIPVAHMHMLTALSEKEKVEHKELFSEMNNSGFEGFISIEKWNPGDRDPIEEVQRGILLQKELFPS